MKVKCSKCKAENAQGANFCTQCGKSLIIEVEQEDRTADRFKTLVAFLIAIVSIVGAVLAFRITLAAGNAADADVAGIVSSVNLHQARVASEAELYRDLIAYLQGRVHDRLSHDIFAERDLYPGGDPAEDRLWNEGWTETHLSEVYLNEIYIRPEYLRSDGSYDEQGALDINMAGRALMTDFNRDGHFSEADRLRTRVLSLMGMAFVLAISLLFYTLAEVISHSSKYLFVALGSGFFVIAIVGALVIELATA